MLHALIRGKLDSGLCKEDTLTATVFERIFYLPHAAIAKILFGRRLWPDSASPPDLRVRNVWFWPRWDPSQENVGETEQEGEPPASSKERTAIPDLVIEFDDRILVVEAKRWDLFAQQNEWQLAGYWQRARALHPNRPAWLLAVGGLPDHSRASSNALKQRVIRELGGADPDEEVRISAVGWRDLLRAIEDVISGGTAPEARILADIREGMRVHGLQVEKPLPLSDLGAIRAALGPILSRPDSLWPLRRAS